jgi:hypothetical protein
MNKITLPILLTLHQLHQILAKSQSSPGTKEISEQEQEQVKGCGWWHEKGGPYSFRSQRFKISALF